MQTDQSEPEPEEQGKAEQAETEQTQAGQPEQNEPEKLDKAPGVKEIDNEDEIIDLGEEREQVLAEMKSSLAGDKETELAFQIADRFISIQETEDGYDYSIMGADYKEIDGGVYDNPDVSIREALNDIVEDLKENPFDNGARGSIRDDDELMPIDYDGLMEKAEAANHMELQKNIVEDFKAKTNELFHEISEMNPAEIEETVKRHVQAKLDESGIDAKIEEMEEQNYNMIDNVLNNGREKFHKEDAKREQDKSARPSLKARLAEKKAQVAGQGREPEENTKNKQREM